MKPNVGGVYCVFVEQLGLFTASQVTGIKEGARKSQPMDGRRTGSIECDR